MTTEYRWIAFPTPVPIHHIDVQWYATRPGGEARHEPLCGQLDGAIEIDPDGRRFCVKCRVLMMTGEVQAEAMD
jgi:hypothetical protein